MQPAKTDDRLTTCRRRASPSRPRSDRQSNRSRPHRPPQSWKHRPPRRVKPGAVVEEPAQIETTTAAVVEAPRQAEQAALPEDTINADSMPTGSIPHRRKATRWSPSRRWRSPPRRATADRAVIANNTTLQVASPAPAGLVCGVRLSARCGRRLISRFRNCAHPVDGPSA